MTQSTIPKKRTTIYIEPNSWGCFSKICKREGVAPCNKLGKFINQYNQAHSPGNPQLTISVYAKPEEQQPMRVMCLYIKGALTDGRVFCRTAEMWIPGVRCYSCKKNQLRKKP